VAPNPEYTNQGPENTPPRPGCVVVVGKEKQEKLSVLPCKYTYSSWEREREEKVSFFSTY